MQGIRRNIPRTINLIVITIVIVITTAIVVVLKVYPSSLFGMQTPTELLAVALPGLLRSNIDPFRTMYIAFSFQLLLPVRVSAISTN